MIIIGVDNGGTHMRAALFAGTIEKARSEGPGKPMRKGEGATLATKISEIVRPLLARGATRRADLIVVGSSGVGNETERVELERAVSAQKIAWKVVVTTDAELARLAAFGAKPGVLLIAGTGSIAISRDAAGKYHRVGGLGWRMGDQGSGHWIGARGLEAVGNMHDQLGMVTHLAELLPAAVKASGIAGLVRWSVAATPAQIASLAPVVLTAANAGDEVAKGIRDRAVDALAGLAMAAGAGNMPVAFSGGLLCNERSIRRGVTAALKARGVKVKTAAIDVCRGALHTETR